MKTVWLRNLEVGRGAPKVIVPIVGRAGEDILSKAAQLNELSPDAVEWRADFYEDVSDLSKVLDTLGGLREALGDLPLLFTFRTQKEGGERAIGPEDYCGLNLAVLRSGAADAVDVEIFSEEGTVRRIIDAAHAAGKAVVGSSHDHSGTPPREELIARLRRAQDLGADLPKLAVTPRSRADVLTLLSATEEMSRRWADRPIITMSMAAGGVISRLCGEVFGSAMTFGAAGQTSAPGQIPVEELRRVLDILHRSLEQDK